MVHFQKSTDLGFSNARVGVARKDRTAETRADEEPKAERRAEAEQQAEGENSRDESTRGIDERSKTGRVQCNERKGNASRNSLGSALLYWERAAHALVRVVTIATRMVRGAHLTPLTLLIRAAHGRRRVIRARPLRRLRGASRAHGMGGVTSNNLGRPNNFFQILRQANTFKLSKY